MRRLCVSYLSIVGFMLSIFSFSNVFAQEGPPSLVRSVSGIISLDRGQASENYTMEVAVNRHEIDFRPFPLPPRYPIVETKSVNVTIPRGRSSTSYRVTGVSRFGISFSIRITCASCGSVIPTQYAGPDQTYTSLVRFDSDELPTQKNISLLTNNFVSGRVRLPAGQTAPKDLTVKVQLRNGSNSSIVLLERNATILRGQSSTTYAFEQISRFGIGLVQPSISCSNCAGLYRANQAYTSLVNTSQNQPGIDFTLREQTTVLSPILYLLEESE